MKVCVLGSGSRGNSTYVESGTTRLLIDAGFSGKEIERRLAAIGREASSLTAIWVTHEHNDHIAGVGVLSRRYRLPVFVNQACYQAGQRKMGKLAVQREFITGESMTINDLHIHPFSVVHDAADPVGFVISNGRLKVGYCTDTGQITRLIMHHLCSCNTLILESNHDPELLHNGPYPLALQQRIRSKTGHLANGEALDFAADLAGRGALRQLLLAHLSETNNHPDLVWGEAKRKLQQHPGVRVDLVCQDSPGELLTVF